jgi:hypothetical protein
MCETRQRVALLVHLVEDEVAEQLDHITVASLGPPRVASEPES